MQRYNIFNQVHKGLRALLYETALQIQHTDFWNVEEAEPVIKRVEEVIHLFEKHAHVEDNHIFPVVEKYEPSVADAFEQEHDKDHQLGESLATALIAYRNAEVITAKAEAARDIHTAYVRFMTFNLEHMAREEEIINPILWRYYTDADLRRITREIVAGIAPAQMGLFTKWMMRGLHNAEIAGWLRATENEAPEPVFQSLFATAEKELTEKRFRQVLEFMTNGAMVA